MATASGDVDGHSGIQMFADNRLRAVSAVGDSFPLHASANGKAVPASDVSLVDVWIASRR
ncbi:MAG: hypothetical protein F2840_09370 [Actinobacteria bacterium]|jgi:hypothetical protein|uniref:Unannotated protein n=1 Tax=freshwater metagenome TaxID=449393 RepID=A0A6J7KK79_9ZZZZ|nr:hypothetical protein [Actinomycetota bacterium]